MSKGTGKFVVGAALGAGLGLLFAPKSGEETRKELVEKCNELIEKAKHIDSDEVKATIENKIDEIKAEIADLDKEKVIKIAKEKAKIIQGKTEELVKYAKAKGTPILKKIATETKEKTIEVLQSTINKLEQK